MGKMNPKKSTYFFIISIILILASSPLSYFGITKLFFINQNLMGMELFLVTILLYVSIIIAALLIFKLGLENARKNKGD